MFLIDFFFIESENGYANHENGQVNSIDIADTVQEVPLVNHTDVPLSNMEDQYNQYNHRESR